MKYYIYTAAIAFTLGALVSLKLLEQPNTDTVATVMQKSHTKVITKTRIIEHKDGEKETIIDAVSQNDTRLESQESTKSQKRQKMLGIDITYRNGLPLYGVQGVFKVLGPLHITTRINQRAEIGIGLLYEF